MNFSAIAPNLRSLWPRWFRTFLLIFSLTLLGTVGFFSGPAISQGSNPQVICIDYAYYNPMGLVLKQKGWLEESLKKDNINIKVEWVLSQGSNKALKFLNARSLDFGQRQARKS